MEEIIKHFDNLSREQIHQYSCLKAIYESWNSKINLISRKDISNLYINHVLHSLSIAKIRNFVHGTTVIDVGTGGGFPGIPLAIMYPHADFCLLDSINKKIKAVKNICGEIGLKNVSIVCSRMENFYPRKRYNFVVARAVSDIESFYNNVSHLFKDKILYLKGGNYKSEKPKIPIQIKEYKIKDIFPQYPYFEEKSILSISN